MYVQHWNLSCDPFDNDADPRFFFRSQTHQAALLKMRYLVENRKGAGLLVGGFGHGKTYVASQLAHDLPEGCGPVIHLVFPQMSSAELLAYLAVELGADESTVGDHQGGVDRSLRQIERQLIAFGQQNRRPVLIVDEAHLIDDWNVFQSLQLLLNYRTRPEIDFSLILVGDRMLLSRVARLESLDDRISVKSLLQPLSREETEGYVNHRLQAAGATQSIFDAQAIDELFELSGGVPRRINRLCDLALLVGYADGMTQLSAPQVEAVSEELTAVVPD